MKFLIPICLMLSACTTAYYPNGRKAVTIGSNVRNFQFRSGGLELRGDFDNAIVIQKTGAALSQGLMSLGGSVVGGGVLR